MIYEQRKTNEILVAGFGTLASAIFMLGDALSTSLNELSSSLNTSLDQLLDTTRESSRKILATSERQADVLSDQAKSTAAEAKQRRNFEREMVESQRRQEEILERV
jgi:hypothetical protein